MADNPERKKIFSTASKDLILIFILSFFMFMLASKLDAFEMVVEWSRKHEDYEVDEIFVLLVILSFAFAAFSLRRWKELRNEVRKRRRINGELQKVGGDLETRIAERTAELFKTNEELEKEITERKQMEKSLRISEQSYKTLFDNMMDGLLVIDVETMKVMLANQSAMKMYGFDSREEAVGKNLLDFICPDDRQQVALTITEDIFGDAPRQVAEFKAITKSGRDIWVNAVGVGIEFHGRISGLVAIKDITGSKLMEKQLHHAQKMEAIGQLTGGIAHDFNNILSIILGNTELAMMSIDDSDPLHMHLNPIHTSAIHAANLTRQLLVFSRKQPMNFITLSLNRTIDNFLKMINRVIGADIIIETYLAPELWSIRADSGNLEQLLMNLSVNGRDAMPGGGVLTFKTENIILSEDEVEFIPHARSGKFIRLTFEDSGTGMDEGILEKIFEPFFTTKEVGMGTGLGLSVVYGIVREHKGWINVYSELDEGTVFKIYFPACAGKPEEKIEKNISLTGLQGNGEHILLVEDEDKLRKMITTVLGENGYIISAAGNAKEAMDIFTREQGRFHLIFSDIILPGDNGLELVDNLLRGNPDVKVLMCSGYLNHKTQRKTMREKGIPFLQKPYSLHDLLKTIREILNPHS